MNYAKEKISPTEAVKTIKVPVDKCGTKKGKGKRVANSEQEYSDMLLDFVREELGE